jgi:hypothetical protein
MKGDFHVRFCENVGVKFPCVTRLAFIVNKFEIYKYINTLQINNVLKGL